jgi:hypothetical protein
MQIFIPLLVKGGQSAVCFVVLLWDTMEAQATQYRFFLQRL